MSTASIFDSRYSWFRLFVTLAIAAVGNVGMWAIVTIMPGVEAEYGVTRADTSLPYTLAMVGYGVGTLLIGRAVDRFGVVLSLWVAAFSSLLGFGASVLSPNIMVFALWHLPIGFGAGACFAPLMADISHWFAKRRGIAVGIVASGNYFAGAIWPVVLSGVLVSQGWRAVYLVLAVAVPLVMVPLSFLLRARVPEEATHQAERASRENARRASFSPRTLQLLLMVAGIACCVAMSMPQVHIVSLCADLGYGPAVGAEMLSLMLVGGIASRLFSGYIADRLGAVRTILIGSGLQGIALLLYLPFDGLASLYVVSFVFGLSQGGIVPSYALIVREYLPAREAGARVGVVIMATIAGMALGGWMSGFIYDLSGSYRLAFINGIAWNLLNVAILGLIYLRSRDDTMRLAAA
jgi:Sugar phosphate permease